MKNLILAFTILLLSTLASHAQSPDAIHYQAVARNAQGDIIANQPIHFRISILENTENGSPVYVETCLDTTNDFGLADFNIGEGDLVSGSFSAIEWGKSPFYMKVEMDVEGGNQFKPMGTTKIVSVPYAKYADQAGSTTRMKSRLDSLTRAIDSINASLASKSNTFWLSENGGFFIDERDKQRYDFVKIGRQVWLKENMNIGQTINGQQTSTYNDAIEKYAYDDLEDNLDTYGGLYTWREMMQLPDSCATSDCSDLIQTNHQGICPVGWHVPTRSEWQALIDYLGGSAGGKLKETGTAHWNSPNTGGTNATGFTALPGGKKEDAFFLKMGVTAYFGVTNEDGSTNTYTFQLRYDSDQINAASTLKSTAFSVRCIQNK